MSNHTPEPWSKNAISPTVYDGNGIAILRCEGRTLIAENEANARRIVACVNACAGVSTEKLEGEASNLREWHEQMRLDAIDIAARNLDLKDQLTTVTAQRDELLQAMRQIAFATAPEPDDGSEHENAYSLAMGAIEKCGVQP